MEFSSLGYISQQVCHSSEEAESWARVNLVQPLGRDTVNMADAFVYPWPTQVNGSSRSFFALGLPNQGLDPAWDSRTSTPSTSTIRLTEVGRDGQSTSTRRTWLPKRIQAGYAGQAPPVNLLNPVAWAQFIQALRDPAT